MRPWTVEYGTLWAWEREIGRPPSVPVKLNGVFQELTRADVGNVGNVGEVAAAMNLPDPAVVEQRLASGRRCFTLKADGRIITYGWVTHGPESVGELERQFHLYPDEAYVWDCATVPTWRKRGGYSTLLRCIIEQLQEERVPRIWIGASRLNQPSVRGIANAGFTHVIDVTYRRFYRLTLLRLHHSPSAPPSLTSAAYRILINDHERLVGRLAIGYLH